MILFLVLKNIYFRFDSILSDLWQLNILWRKDVSFVERKIKKYFFVLFLTRNEIVSVVFLTRNEITLIVLLPIIKNTSIDNKEWDYFKKIVSKMWMLLVLELYEFKILFDRNVLCPLNIL